MKQGLKSKSTAQGQQQIYQATGSGAGGKRTSKVPASRQDIGSSEGSRNTYNSGQHNPSLQSFGATKNSGRGTGATQGGHDPSSQYLFGTAKISKSPPRSGKQVKRGSARGQSRGRKDGSEAITGADNQSELEGSPTFNRNSAGIDSINTPSRSKGGGPVGSGESTAGHEYGRNSLPSPQNNLGSNSGTALANTDNRGHSANLLLQSPPTLPTDITKKEEANQISTIKRAVNDSNPITICRLPSANDKNTHSGAEDTDEESAQFLGRPSGIDSQHDEGGWQDGYATAGQGNAENAAVVGDQDTMQNIKVQNPHVSGYNSGYSSGPAPSGSRASPRVARFKAKTAGIRQQWQKKSMTRKSQKNTEYIKVQESMDHGNSQTDEMVPAGVADGISEFEGATINRSTNENNQQVSSSIQLPSGLDPAALNPNARVEIMTTTPTPNTQKISDMNPMLMSQTTSYRGSHIIPQNFTVSGSIPPEQKLQTVQNNKRKTQQKKSFTSSNDVRDHLKPNKSYSHNQKSQTGRETPELNDQSGNKKQIKGFQVDSGAPLDKIEVEIQKTGPIKHIIAPLPGPQFTARATSPNRIVSGRSPRPQAKRGAQGQAHQGPPGGHHGAKKGTRGSQMGNKGKNQKELIETGAANGVQKQKKTMKDKNEEVEAAAAGGNDARRSFNVYKPESEQRRDQIPAPLSAGLKIKNKGIDPYVKGLDSNNASFSKLQPEDAVITPEEYQDMIEQFLLDYEPQFDVFETGYDGEFKPIFMVGKCPPPEKELLKQSILSTLSNKSKSRGNSPSAREPNQTSEKQSIVNLHPPANKLMTGSISLVSGGIGTKPLSVIQSESKEETEISGLHLVPAVGSEIISNKQLQTQDSESQKLNANGIRFGDMKSDQSGVINASAVAGPDLNQSIQAIDNAANPTSRNTDITSGKNKFKSQKGSKNTNSSSNNYDALLSNNANPNQLPSSITQQKRVPARNSGLAATNKTLPVVSANSAGAHKKGAMHVQTPNISVKNSLNIVRGAHEKQLSHNRVLDDRDTSTPRDMESRRPSPLKHQHHASGISKDANTKTSKATVKRIGVDLNGQGRRSSRKSSSSQSGRPGNLTIRNSVNPESGLSARKSSQKPKRTSEPNSAANVYNQVGRLSNAPQQQPSRRTVSSINTRTTSDNMSQARRNNGKQPKNSEVKTISFKVDVSKIRNASPLNQTANKPASNDLDDSIKENQPSHYATVRNSQTKDNLVNMPGLSGVSPQKGAQNLPGSKKSFQNQANNQEISGSAVKGAQSNHGGNQMPLSNDLSNRLMQDYDNSPKLGPANKKDKNFVRAWEKILEKFDKKGFLIQNLKDFKALTRSINLVPNFTSEYRVSQVFAAHDLYAQTYLERPPQTPLKKHDTLRCLFLLFSVSTSVQDLQMYGQSNQQMGGGSGGMGLKGEQDSQEQDQLSELTDKLQSFGKGANIYEIDLDLAQKMNDARNKFLKQWIKQQVKLGANY